MIKYKYLFIFGLLLAAFLGMLVLSGNYYSLRIAHVDSVYISLTDFQCRISSGREFTFQSFNNIEELIIRHQIDGNTVIQSPGLLRSEDVDLMRNREDALHALLKKYNISCMEISG